jgi:hypothetical protein
MQYTQISQKNKTLFKKGIKNIHKKKFATARWQTLSAS